jgi:hypothetical protein
MARQEPYEVRMNNIQENTSVDFIQIPFKNAEYLRHASGYHQSSNTKS